MSDQDRFYQPQNAKDAMRFVQKLFNQYNQAPLTEELIAYHQKLLAYLTNGVTTEVQKQANSEQAEKLTGMIEAMQNWLKIRLSGQPYAGKMQHFKFVPDSQQAHFKTRTIKGGKKANNLRTSARH
ncbi:hypothetical protein QN289_03425 [Latilactobacillus curvatus]|uniref:hypothetical protein n=1 Tax=Latilactobacillus curvatus TaxID=28038 RepID=UPI000230F5ED|nr:hypothetical protein [Latilactobacillus curvatus]EHE85438.1 hypothetical protein CRL705_1484 [Latilactobacillus curvatus CRL 705]MCS8617508.1 hypothetical protein [Latilactobacillus curvatus]MDG2980490.1 hypothetical protein [Latilactobacillus curvatus]MDG2984038.1 hypothetical protein [Latilactobacillus curvatus]QEA48390.1 hypothetical protein FGL79_00150 [Latilactobacillus curvatus]